MGKRRMLREGAVHLSVTAWRSACEEVRWEEKRSLTYKTCLVEEHFLASGRN